MYAGKRGTCLKNEHFIKNETGIAIIRIIKYRDMKGELAGGKPR